MAKALDDDDDDDGHAESNALWEHIQEIHGKKYKQPNLIAEAATAATAAVMVAAEKKETQFNAQTIITTAATVEHEFSVYNHYQIVKYKM